MAKEGKMDRDNGGDYESTPRVPVEKKKVGEGPVQIMDKMITSGEGRDVNRTRKKQQTESSKGKRWGTSKPGKCIKPDETSQVITILGKRRKRRTRGMSRDQPGARYHQNSAALGVKKGNADIHH